MQKIATLAVKHNMSQNELVDLILESVSDVVIESIVIEAKAQVQPKRTLRVRRVATWGG